MGRLAREVWRTVPESTGEWMEALDVRSCLVGTRFLHGVGSGVEC